MNRRITRRKILQNGLFLGGLGIIAAGGFLLHEGTIPDAVAKDHKEHMGQKLGHDVRLKNGKRIKSDLVMVESDGQLMSHLFPFQVFSSEEELAKKAQKADALGLFNLDEAEKYT